ncbi:hypothetical protein P7K49_023863, partial [Saguinus oedipus]
LYTTRKGLQDNPCSQRPSPELRKARMLLTKTENQDTLPGNTQDPTQAPTPSDSSS